MCIYLTASFSRGNIQSQFCAPELIQQNDNPNRCQSVSYARGELERR